MFVVTISKEHPSQCKVDDIYKEYTQQSLLSKQMDIHVVQKMKENVVQKTKKKNTENDKNETVHVEPITKATDIDQRDGTQNKRRFAIWLNRKSYK